MIIIVLNQFTSSRNFTNNISDDFTNSKNITKLYQFNLLNPKI